MEFTQAPDDLKKQLFCRMISENGKFEMGVHPMAFGMRLRAGFVDDNTGCLLDYCAGEKQDSIEVLYGLSLKMLSEIDEEDDSTLKRLLRQSTIKPFYKDIDFLQWLINKAGGKAYMYPLPPMEDIRVKLLENILTDPNTFANLSKTGQSENLDYVQAETIDQLVERLSKKS